MKEKNVRNKPKVNRNPQGKKPSARSAKESKHKHEKYRFLFDSAPIGMGIADLEGKVLDANQSMQEMTGYPLEELKQLGAGATYVNPDERKLLLENLQKKGRIRDWEVGMKRKDGTLYTALLNVDMLELDGQEVLLTTARDITERKVAEKKLEAAHAFLQSIIDGVAEPIMVIGKNYQVKLMNMAAKEFSSQEGTLLCYEVSHHRDKPCDGIMHPCPLKQVRNSGRSVMLMHEHCRQNGEKRYVEILASPLLGKDGSFQGIIESSRDVTARKLAEERLRLFSEAVENALDGIQITDLDGYIMYSNKAVEKIYGFSPEEYKGKHVNEMNADPEFAGKVIIPSIKETGRWVGELMVKHKNGTVFPIWLTASTVRNGMGEPIALVGIIKDLSERKQIEEALREREERYRSLFENSPISLWEEDSSGIKNYIDSLRTKGVKDFRKYFDNNPEEVTKCVGMVNVLNVNKATVKLFSAGSKEELLAGLNQIFTQHSYSVFKRELEAIAKGRTMFEDEDIVKNLKGELMHIYLKWSVAPGHETTYSKRLVSIIDITERKKAEEDVVKYASQLEEANRMKDMFTDIMHHDLLNPLSTASSYVELLLEEETEKEKRAYAEKIKRNLIKGIELIESTTMLSKLESMESIEFEDMDLKEIIEKVIDNLKLLASKAGMKIESKLISMPARGNRIIEEVFANLISNAIKYAPAGKKVVVGSEEKEKCWRIKVTDYGEGIKDAYKGLIFDRFQRMEKKGVKGSGLGLAIARKIVELHKGKIWVEDNPEGGAVFIVEVPKV